MFKIKGPKNPVKFVIPNQRVRVLRIRIPAIEAGVYKVPHINMLQPRIVRMKTLDLKPRKLKLKLWAQRFFILTIPRFHQKLDNAFRYQLKKYSTQLANIPPIRLIKTKSGYQIALQKIKTHIDRKRVRPRKQLHTKYKFKIPKVEFEIKKGNLIQVTNFRIIDCTELISSFPVEITEAKINEATPPEESIQASAPSDFLQPAVEAADINTVPSLPLKARRVTKTSDFGVQSSASGDKIQPPETPPIKSVGLSALQIYSLPQKNGGDEKEQTEKKSRATKAS